jgi:aromatic ring-opening dioxygenase catalytic subunit (LigB family)
MHNAKAKGAASEVINTRKEPTTMPCLTFNHGSGRGDGPSTFLAEYVKSLPDQPSGIVVIEAHVEADPVELAGDPELVARVAALMRQQDIDVRVHRNQNHVMGHGAEDAKRALHRLALPFVTMSLKTGQRAAEHLAIGAGLSPLREAGILLLGSGVPSFHNFHVMFSKSQSFRSLAAEKNRQFDEWLSETMSSNFEERRRRLCSWEKAPGAMSCHPIGEAEHFMPTLVIVGAALNSQGRPVGDASHKLILPKLSKEFEFRHFEFR